MRLRIADCGLRIGLLAALVVVPGTALAQVGHDPGRSPYHDLRARQAASIVGGFLRGERGTPRAGPSDGPLVGIRYDRQVGAATEVVVGLAGARLERFVIDPALPPETRATGPIRNDLIFMEAGASLLLTGRKTWRGFQPYVGAMLGVAFETDITGAGEFNFGTRLALTPHAGIKWFPVQAIAFRAEVRDVIWRLRYPDSWFASVGGVAPVLNPATDKSAEWLHHPTFALSLGYTFTF
jgi:hypothetical protein